MGGKLENTHTHQNTEKNKQTKSLALAIAIEFLATLWPLKIKVTFPSLPCSKV